MPRRIVGGFELRGELGRGGMGVVCEAYDPKLDRVIAVKVLPRSVAPDDHSKRFLVEARAAARLSHPNIVTVYAVGEDKGLQYIAMERVHGKSLAGIIKPGQTMPVLDALQLIRQAADALAAAHEHGIVHRDIKPHNIMVDNTGKVKVLDFGLAKFSAASVDMTASGALIGTPRYMAPEQVEGEAADARSDIYALGVVFYELLLGRPAISGDSPIVAMYQIKHEPFPVTALAEAGLPKNVIDLIAKMTARNPDERFQSASALMEALDKLQSTSSNDAGIGPQPDKKEIHQRKRVLFSFVLVTCLVGITVLVVAIAVFWNRSQASLPSSSTPTTAVPVANPPTIRTFDGGEFVWINPGTFEMGSRLSPAKMVKDFGGKPEHYAGETPHKVILIKGYWLGAHEVTNAEFEACVNATGFQTQAEKEGSGNTNQFDGRNEITEIKAGISWRNPGWQKLPQEPVVLMSWFDTQAYIEWLNSKGEVGGKYRLPSEAEWEYAYRAGTSTEFFWGERIRDGINYLNAADLKLLPPRQYPGMPRFGFDDGYRKLAPVGSFRPNPWGLYDMAGNVAEWCESANSGDTVTEPQMPSTGENRILRGGAWVSGPGDCRAASRTSRPPSVRHTAFGFRLLRTQD